MACLSYRVSSGAFTSSPVIQLRGTCGSMSILTAFHAFVHSRSFYARNSAAGCHPSSAGYGLRPCLQQCSQRGLLRKPRCCHTRSMDCFRPPDAFRRLHFVGTTLHLFPRVKQTALLDLLEEEHSIMNCCVQPPLDQPCQHNRQSLHQLPGHVPLINHDICSHQANVVNQPVQYVSHHCLEMCLRVRCASRDALWCRQSSRGDHRWLKFCAQWYLPAPLR